MATMPPMHPDDVQTPPGTEPIVVVTDHMNDDICEVWMNRAGPAMHR